MTATYRISIALLIAMGLFASGLANAQNDATGEEDSFVIEEVIVTAQKREESIHDIPVSVSALAGSKLEDIGASSLADYAAYVPGLNFSSGGSPGLSTITLRGVSPLGSTASVATYIDESPMVSSALFAAANTLTLDLFPYDIERIEVVRGPQGTLYGANALGGLLKYVTRRPGLDNFSGRAGADIRSIKSGGNGSFGLRGLVNIPIVPGEFAISASGFHQKTDGYIDNVNTGEKDVNEITQEGGRLAGLWVPNDRFSLYLSAIFQSTDADDANFAWYDFFTSEPLGGDLEMGYDLPNSFKQDIAFYSVIAEYDFGWADFVSATSYSDIESQSNSDFTPGFGSIIPVFTGGLIPSGVAPFDVDIDVKKFTQELRLASSGEHRVDWLIGAYYANESNDNNQLGSALTPDGTLIPGLNPIFVAIVPSEYEEIAVFGNLTFNVTDRFDITAGLRWTSNDQSFNQYTNGLLTGFIPTNGTGKSSEDVVTYSLSAPFHVTEDVMIYGRFATGYRPGGPNVLLPGVPPSVDADTLNSYEVGIKARIFDQLATVELSAFYNDWSDIQTHATTAAGLGYLVNSDSAEIRGIEFASFFYPAEGLQLGFNFAYTNAEFTSDSPSIGAVNGDPLPQVPEWQGAITFDYQRQMTGTLDWDIGGGWRYVGEQETYNVFFGPRTIRDYDILDLRTGISTDRWRISLFVKNVLDERAHLNESLEFDQLFGTPLFTRTSISQPRTIGLALDVEF